MPERHRPHPHPHKTSLPRDETSQQPNEIRGLYGERTRVHQNGIPVDNKRGKPYPTTSTPTSTPIEAQEVLSPEEIKQRVQERVDYQAGRYIELEKEGQLPLPWKQFAGNHPDLIAKKRTELRLRRAPGG